MTIAHAIALPEGRQDEESGGWGQVSIGTTRGVAWWSPRAIIGALLLILAPSALAQPPAPKPADSAWATAVDRYLAGDRVAAGGIVLRTTATDVTKSSEHAFQGWRVAPASDTAARREVIRHLQGSALLPLELMLMVSGHSLPEDLVLALEDTSREAWRRLAAFDDEGDDAQRATVRRFRTWWRLGFLEHLIASSRFSEASREADATHAPDSDREAQATLSLLRGIAFETRARLADAAPSATVAVTMRRLPQASRMNPMRLAMDDAGKAYRRALELAPSDRETTLRLARVAVERDRLDEAGRLLEPLLQVTCRDTVCGLAYLFMGEVHEARKEGERASSAYARASSVGAVRPAALIAMMQLSLRRGNAGGAYDLTRQFSTPAALARSQAPDAWSQYIGGRLVEGDRVLATLVAAVVP